MLLLIKYFSTKNLLPYFTAYAKRKTRIIVLILQFHSPKSSLLTNQPRPNKKVVTALPTYTFTSFLVFQPWRLRLFNLPAHKERGASNLFWPIRRCVVFLKQPMGAADKSQVRSRKAPGVFRLLSQRLRHFRPYCIV